MENYCGGDCMVDPTGHFCVLGTALKVPFLLLPNNSGAAEGNMEYFNAIKVMHTEKIELISAVTLQFADLQRIGA